MCSDTNMLLAHHLRHAHYMWHQQEHFMNLTQGSVTTANRKQHNIQTHQDNLDGQYTSYGSDHGNNGTPPCGRFHCNPYQIVTKRTRIQTSGKSR